MGASAILLALTVPVTSIASGESLPPIPDWQTDAANCSWKWHEGGGIGLWAETCNLNGTIWRMVWDDRHGAFVTRGGDIDMGISVQAFSLPDGMGMDALSDQLIAAGHLDTEAPCAWTTVPLREAPRTMSFRVLAPKDPTALAANSSGEIPVPICGRYGASTHGLRYFITDLRWPDRMVFVEEGQERPLFDPMSITLLP